MPYDGIGRGAAQRPQLRRTRLRCARCARLFRPRPLGGVASSNPATSTGTRIFGRDGARWFHCGGIFAALSASAAEVALEAMTAARRARHGRLVRPQLPAVTVARHRRSGGGGRDEPLSSSRLVDVLLGNEEDFSAALGFELGRRRRVHADLDAGPVRAPARRGARRLSEHRPRRDVAARGAHGDPQRLERRLQHARTIRRRPADGRTWRSSTAWEAAIHSPPA